MVHRSYYDLRFGVSPGGARKDAHYICADLDEAESALAYELEDSTNVWLILRRGGADLALDVYQRGELTRSIDLHPFLTVRIGGYPDITFLGQGRPSGYADGADDPDQVRATLVDGLFGDDFDDTMEAVVDWARVPAPALVGEPVGEDDYVRLGDGPPDDLSELEGLDEDELTDELIERGYVEYGFHDFDA
ncbi:hypothetical protein [Streptomyces boluensis]|uniref:Uncharacterized protein n=1 Tax=Streptomyces boluensis TaxID=1775135 RepID=A0A964UNB8_9ACTN|nr:hypothetical protein [Streptomyces boluensis]NBE52211.1 hypothetical protein [Streptomyces boluensis]